MKTLKTTIPVVLAVLVMVLAPPAVADHKSGHNPGKPSPSPSPEPTPEPPKLVNVTLKVSVEHDYAVGIEVRSCGLIVPEWSSGWTVLTAAVDAGCIRSFETEFSQWGSQLVLRCLDDVCNGTASFDWWTGPYGNLGGSFSEGGVMEAKYISYQPYVPNCC